MGTTSSPSQTSTPQPVSPLRRRLLGLGVCLGVALATLGTPVGSAHAASTGGAATTQTGTHSSAKATLSGPASTPRPKAAPSTSESPRFGALRPTTTYLATDRLSSKALATLPASVDLSGYAVSAKTQGQTSSCVAYAIGYALMGWEARRAGLGAAYYAPFYLYSQINGGRDAGSWAHDALPIAVNQGVDVVPHYWQQNSGDMFTQPSLDEKANAQHWRLTGYTKLYEGSTGTTSNQGLIKSALAAGHPVPISLNVRPGLQNYANVVDTDYTSPYTRNSDGSVAGHEVLALGYNATGVYFQNSWGTTYKNQGFGWLSWNVVNTDVTSIFQVSGFKVTGSTTTDTTGPSLSVPTSAPELQSTTSTAGLTRYLTSFTASDASGISSTVTDVQVDGGAWQAVSQAGASSTTTVTNLTPGHTYRFAVAAYDGLNNFSGWAYGPTFAVNGYPELNAAVAYSTGWTSSSWASAVGGGITMSATPNASATFSFTGQRVSWIATQASSRGQAYLYADGVYQTTINLYAATTRARAVVATTSWGAVGTHTLRIVVVGTAGHPTVDLDNFIVTR